MDNRDDIILKRFEEPDEVRSFEKGKFELVHFEGMTMRTTTEAVSTLA